MRRVERGGRRRRQIGDPRPQYRPPLRLADLDEIDPVEQHGAGGDTATGTRIAHGGEADRRFAGAGLADQPEHLAAAQRQVDALDDLVPAVVALALDAQAADLEQYLARVGRSVHVLRALANVHPLARSSWAATSRPRN